MVRMQFGSLQSTRVVFRTLEIHCGTGTLKVSRLEYPHHEPLAESGAAFMKRSGGEWH